VEVRHLLFNIGDVVKSQPYADYQSNDIVYTPESLAKKIVGHFEPTGSILEPCRGGGAFSRHMPGCDWCEITEGKDFYKYHKKVDWIITNPPWSDITKFLTHCMEVADNIVFLVTINHLWTTARLRAMDNAGFAFKEVARTPWPDKSSGFPRSGFELGAVYIKKNYKGSMKVLGI
jgi:hypothetical protein